MKKRPTDSHFGVLLAIVGAACVVAAKTDFLHGFGVGIIIAGAVLAGVGLSYKAE